MSASATTNRAPEGLETIVHPLFTTEDLKAHIPLDQANMYSSLETAMVVVKTIITLAKLDYMGCRTLSRLPRSLLLIPLFLKIWAQQT